MNADDLIDAKTACALLGVQPQTLYAYVSRGLITAQSDIGDARRSLYLRSDVDALARKHRRSRARVDVARQAIRWGDPILSTSVSHVRDGVLYFGDTPALECAAKMSLEQVAAHHWRVADLQADQVATVPRGETGLARAIACLGMRASDAPPLQGRSRDEIARDGAQLMSDIASAVLGQTGTGAIHQRFRDAWDLSPHAAAQVRRALVLLSDHELNPSTFAVRVCASTGAGLAASALAGLCTLSGPKHGGVAGKALEAVQAAARGPGGVQAFLSAHAHVAPYAFGYGHPLYPQGDPRAACLLKHEAVDAPAARAVRRLARTVDAAPNIDAALAVLCDTHRLPPDAGFAIFCAGRMAGWIAHAIEQSHSDQIIRPRARYVSPDQADLASRSSRTSKGTPGASLA